MKKLIFIGGTVAVLGMSFIVGAFFAGPLIAGANSNATSAPPAGDTYCSLYNTALAANLHVNSDTLNADRQGARKTALSQSVTGGQLTAAQATAIAHHQQAKQPCTGANANQDRLILRQFLLQHRTDMLSDIATGLNIDQTTLQTNWKSKSLSQITKVNNPRKVVLDTVQNLISNAGSNLTPTQASTFSQWVKNHPQMIVNIVHRIIVKSA